MRRWAMTAALLLTICATLPVRADDFADCGNVGTLLKTDPERAASACRRLADQGVADAQQNLGNMYRKGQGVPQDYAEAAKWFRKAAEQGRADAENNLGKMYENGLGGLPRDYGEALTWFQKAADQGDAIAQGNLADMYENGRGVPRDFTEVASWHRKAADQGYASLNTTSGCCTPTVGVCRRTTYRHTCGLAYLLSPANWTAKSIPQR
jgi:TPR repeat protein